ncbi:hypothetical protein [Antarctobacter heliothermus]
MLRIDKVGNAPKRFNAVALFDPADENCRGAIRYALLARLLSGWASGLVA